MTVGEVGAGPGDGSRAVAIGGGHGLSRCLRALTHVVDHVTGIITTADDGGSSGRLRRELGIIPPGDMRMALAALSPRRDLVRLIQYRFEGGELDGHSFGNLLIAATISLHGGDIVEAMDYVASILGVRGRVLPCTLQPVVLQAQAEDHRVEGQVEVARSRRIEKVWLDPDEPEATPEAVRAVERADLVVIGPGSLFTSIIPNLLVPGIASSVIAVGAPVALIANLREQPGETEGLDLVGHVDALTGHVPGLDLSAVVAHAGAQPPGPGEPLRADRDRISAPVVTADLLHPDGGHDPRTLAIALDHLLRSERSGRG